MSIPLRGREGGVEDERGKYASWVLGNGCP